MDLLGRLFPYLAYLAAAIVLAAIGILIFLFLILRKAGKKEPLRLGIAPSAPPQPRPSETKTGFAARFAQSRALGASISMAIRRLRENASARDYLYQTPWFMVLGESASGKSTLLQSAAIHAALLEEAEDFGIHQAIRWHFFNQGVVLDVYGDYVLRAGDLTSDESGWENLLKQLQSRRPRRPLDGVVVALPVEDFLAPRCNDAEALEAKAARLMDKLWRAQKILGLSLPLYVLVTKCDQIPGFRGFFREIPAPNRQDIFGWSSPYSLAASFKPDWVNEAFESLGRDLNQLQCEIFTARNRIADADEVFVFPGEFDSLRAPLRIFLARMLKETAYRESFYFRGLYFCGDPDWAPFLPVQPAEPQEEARDPFAEPAPQQQESGLAASPGRSPCRPVFLTRLFQEKIFPEAAIARPIPRVFRSKSRLVWGAQLTAAALALLLTWGMTKQYLDMREMWSRLQPALQKISNEMGPAAGAIESGESACDLVGNMAQLNTNVFSSWFMPLSLAVPLDNRVKRAMAPAFNREVLTALRELLERKADQVLAPPALEAPAAESAPPISTGPPAVGSYSPEKTPEFQDLRSFADDAAALAVNIRRYELLRRKGQGGSEQLTGLLNYLGLRCVLPPDYADNPYFQDVVGSASGEPFDSGHLKNGPEKLKVLMLNYFNAWLNENPLARNVLALQAQIQGLETQQNPGLADLRNLDRRILLVKALLADPDFSWLWQTNLDTTSPPYRDAIDAARRTRFLDPRTEHEVQTTAENDFQSLRYQLETSQTGLTGSLFQPEGNSFQLSQGASDLQLDLENLMNLPFVQAETAPAPATALAPQPDAALIWESGPLKAAINRYEAYRRFVAEGLRSSSPELETAFRTIALHRLQSSMDDLVDRARTYVGPLEDSSSADASAAELKSFAEAEPYLSQILDIFQKLGFYDSYADLRDSTTAQAFSLLASLDGKLRSTRPYVEKDGNFFWWRGEPDPALRAFGASNAAELDAYLAFERRRIESLAEEAAPLIHFLQARTLQMSEAQAQTYDKWRQIVAAMNAYRQKIPGNPVASLEDFIRTDMNKFSPARYCQGVPAGNPESPSANYFVQRRNELRQSIDNQCKYLADRAAYANYTALAKLFNSTLAGKFPFAAPGEERPSDEADPGAIQAFYRLLDQHEQATHLALTRTSSFGPTRESALQFLNRMEDLRPLFSSLLSTPDAKPVVVVDFVPYFRVNRADEVGGDEIIGWSLRAGPEVLHAHEPHPSGRWQSGEPVSLSLRWAKDSPAVPVAEKNESDLNVEGRVAAFEYSDEWSLFSLLEQHHAPPAVFPRMVDPEPYTLEFKLETVESLSLASKAGVRVPKETRVFVRVAIMPPGSKKPLGLLPFPAKAPQLVWWVTN